MKQSNRSQQLYLVNVSVVIMLLVLVGILGSQFCPSPPFPRWKKESLQQSPSGACTAGFPASMPSSTMPTMPTPFRRGSSWCRWHRSWNPDAGCSPG